MGSAMQAWIVHPWVYDWPIILGKHIGNLTLWVVQARVSAKGPVRRRLDALVSLRIFAKTRMGIGLRKLEDRPSCLVITSGPENGMGYLIGPVETADQ